MVDDKNYAFKVIFSNCDLIDILSAKGLSKNNITNLFDLFIEE